MRAKNGSPHVCCTCGRRLKPNRDAVVYLGWGLRHDGAPGPGWVAALCAPDQAHVTTGSPCVDAARQWAASHQITLVPSDYQAWLGL